MPRADLPHRLLRSWWIGGLASILVLCPTVIFARTSSPAANVNYHVPAGTLDDALKAFADQSHIQLLYSPRLVRGKRSPGLNSTLDKMAALARLLEGHSLAAVPVNANTYILQPVTRPQPAPRAKASTVQHSQPQGAAPVQHLGNVSVTGTRIPRTSLETVMPITLITSEDIERSGHETLFELLRAMPGMWGHHPTSVATEDGRSFQPIGPAATTSLYSFGPRATLFLVDGRRVATYAVASSQLGGVVDLNSIPLSFIDRIEILRGGASAIYGADAIAGTVNIILKKYAPGLEGSARIGVSARGDAGMKRFSSGFGTRTPRDGHLLINVDIMQRAALEGDSRDWHTANLKRFGLGDEREPLGAIFNDNGTVTIRPLPSCIATGKDPDAPQCRFDGARFRTLQPRLLSQSAYAYWHQPVGMDINLNASARISRISQELQTPPLMGAVQFPDNHPDVNLLDPLSRTAILAMYEMGPTHNHTISTTRDFAIGLEGNAGNWHWQVDVSHSENSVNSRVWPVVLIPSLGKFTLQYRIDGSNNAPSLFSSIGAEIHPRGRDVIDMLSASTEGTAFSTSAGAARMVLGLEHRRRRASDQPDPLQVSGALSLAAANTVPYAFHDYASALFAELNIPLHRRLQLDVAARMDHNAGTRHSNVSPHFGMKWTPDERLMLRASMGKGYRAPSAHDTKNPLYYTTSPTLTFIENPPPALLPCTGSPSPPTCILEYGTANNPKLRPEISRSVTAGIVWAPTPSFNLALDHYRITREREFGIADPAQYPQLFPEGLIRNADGVLYRANLHFANIGRTEVRGWELDANYLWKTEDAGKLRFRAGIHYLERQSRTQITDPGNVIEFAGHDIPRLTMLNRLEWQYGDWTTMLDMRYFSGMYAYPAGQTCPESRSTVDKCKNPSTMLLGLGVEYAFSDRWKFSLNVANLADRQPVNYRTGQNGYNSGIDDPYGRYYTFTSAYQF